MSTHVSREEDERAPTTELVTSAVGDRCTNCQAPLASDQRYCVNCGARRGKPRFTTESLAAHTPAAPVQVSERPAPPRPRLSAATTLVAGVATLLLAMGVGVLIGHNSNTPPARAAAQQVITVGGGASTAPASSPSTASSRRGKHSKTRATRAHKTKVTVVHLTPKTTKAAAAAATKVLGDSAPKNPTVTTGQACTAGSPGCQNGHFTGTFFAP